MRIRHHITAPSSVKFIIHTLTLHSYIHIISFPIEVFVVVDVVVVNNDGNKIEIMILCFYDLFSDKSHFDLINFISHHFYYI